MNLYKDGDGGGGTGLFVEYTSLPSQCGVKTSVATARFRFAIASNQVMAVLSPGFTTFNSGVHLRGAALRKWKAPVVPFARSDGESRLIGPKGAPNESYY